MTRAIEIKVSYHSFSRDSPKMAVGIHRGSKMSQQKANNKEHHLTISTLQPWPISMSRPSPLLVVDGRSLKEGIVAQSGVDLSSCHASTKMKETLFQEQPTTAMLSSSASCPVANSDGVSRKRKQSEEEDASVITYKTKCIKDDIWIAVPYRNGKHLIGPEAAMRFREKDSGMSLTDESDGSSDDGDE